MSQTILSGRYVLNDVIGTGGMSVVYRAIDNQTGSEVAIKVMRQEQLGDEEFVRRFDREAMAAGRMSHENIVSVLDVGHDGDLRYIVMEYVKGATLKATIREVGQIPPQKAINIALRILAAADHAHVNNIIHRDIKPQNIMIDNSGRIKVGDFGIARMMNSNTVTFSDGSVLGSVHYLSPEQARGETVDERGDLYSIGIVLYEMLTGRVPFEAETPVSVVMKHVQSPPPKLRTFASNVSVGLEQVVLKSLAKRPEDRYQSASEMAFDLKRTIKQPGGGFVRLPPDIIEGDTTIISGSSFASRLWKYRLVAVLAMLCLIAVGLIALREDWLFKSVRVPDVTDMTIEQAISELVLEGLAYAQQGEYSQDVTKGVVIAQTPIEGEYVRSGERVNLIVSQGRASVPMPTLVGNQMRDLEALLSNSGLEPGVATPILSSQPKGVIVDQSIDPGLPVEADTAIDVSYSGDTVSVPDFTKRSLAEAQTLIVEKKLGIGQAISREDNAPPNTVIDQSPAAFTEVMEGAVVILTIATPPALVYRREVQLKFTVEDASARVQVVMINDDGEHEDVMDETMQHGENTVSLRLTSEAVGEKRLCVYVAGKIVHEQSVVFAEKDKA